jgi:FkbM family methyltransferase
MRYPMRRRNRIDDEHMRLALAFTLRETSNCIDVGAHYGDVLQHFVRFAPRGRHIAYEPIPAAAASLARNFPGVEIRQAVAGDEHGTTQFAHVLNDEGRSGILRHHNYEQAPKIETLTVAQERLDELLPQFRPDVIKIDVEGAELQVLRGAMQLIREHRPTIFFEHFKGGSEVYGTTPGEVWGLLDEAGMRLFDIDGEGPLSLPDLQWRFESGEIWQFVATPR